ncbi:MAG: putative toxin-antitoxin system toxin component, PIN family [Rubrobacteraceae bacterium]
MRIVFDTNVYISAIAFARSKSALAFGLAHRGAFELAASEEIVAELVGKLAEPKFGFSDAKLKDAEHALRGIATLVRPATRLSVLEDEPDNRILECAIEAGASAIVTGDKELLALKKYEGIGIMTVAELLYTFPEFGV